MTKGNTTKQRRTETRNPDKQTQTKQTPKYLTGGKWLPAVYAVLFAIFAYYMLAIKNADYLYAVLLENAGLGKLRTQIKARLSAQIREKRIGSFLIYYLGEPVNIKRLDISDVCNIGVCHYGSRI